MSGTAEWQSVMRRAAAGYFIVQGLAGLLWWGLLLTYSPAASWFLPRHETDLLMRSLMIPDIALFSLGSLVAAGACWMDRHATVVASIVMGAVWYATLLALGFGLSTGDGWLGAVAMVGAAIASTAALLLTTGTSVAIRAFRVVRRRSTSQLAALTVLQSAVFWCVLLFILPMLLARLERHAGVPTLAVSGRLMIIGAMLFIAGAALGVVSAVYMVRCGRGTPLPTAAAPVMVTQGPYCIVRNPMAIGGLCQGLGVAAWLGSPTVVAYVLLGALIWHITIRPLEEHDLAIRFGEPFEWYRSTLNCWVPRIRLR